jgi:hypothetical protein
MYRVELWEYNSCIISWPRQGTVPLFLTKSDIAIIYIWQRISGWVKIYNFVIGLALDKDIVISG